MGIILGLIKPTKGEIHLLGKNFLKHRSIILKKINFASPYLDLPKKLTVMQNLVFYSRMYGIFKNAEIIDYLAKKLLIEDLLHREFGSLSSGQKTKVCLCKSLVNSPKLLLLDEPTASLDPETSFFIRGFLSEYQKKHKIIILLASHNMNEIEEICKEVIVLNKGEIVLKGKPSILIKKDPMRKSLLNFLLHRSTLFSDNGSKSILAR